MKFILEYKKYKPVYEIGEIVLIHYWYNWMVTPVKIIEKRGRKYLVSHNIEKSEIQNAPDELVTEIISKFRG